MNVKAGRIQELDGLRGVAILSVFLFHLVASLPEPRPRPVVLVLSNGWMGVDLFFVLSGFLITNGLLALKKETGYFRIFYIKRTLRIFPVYYVFLIIVAIYFSATACGDLCRLQPLFWLYIQNWPQALTTDLSFLFLGHFWSLAIEEQFYLCWPIVVYALTVRQLSMVCLGVIFGCLAFRIVAPADTHFLYYSTIARLDCLAFGALATTCLQKPDIGRFDHFWLVLFATSASLLAAIAIIDTSFFHNRLMLTLGLSMTGLVGFSSIMILTANKPKLLSSAMRLPLLGTFGKYSYAAYIFHLPIMFFVTQAVEDWHLKSRDAAMIILTIPAILTYLAAWLSWVAIERPAMNFRAYLLQKSHGPLVMADKTNIPANR